MLRDKKQSRSPKAISPVVSKLSLLYTWTQSPWRRSQQTIHSMHFAHSGPTFCGLLCTPLPAKALCLWTQFLSSICCEVFSNFLRELYPSRAFPSAHPCPLYHKEWQIFILTSLLVTSPTCRVVPQNSMGTSSKMMSGNTAKKGSKPKWPS